MAPKRSAPIICLLSTAIVLLAVSPISLAIESSISGNLGMDLKIIHTPEGKDAIRYLDPHEADPEKVFSDDEYLCQYLDLAVSLEEGRTSADLAFRLGTNYLGTGFIDGNRVFDQGLELSKLHGIISTPHLTINLGDDLPLGFTQYLYSLDGTEPAPYIDGIKVDVLQSYLLAVGQTTYPEWNGTDEDHDIRYIALSADKIMGLPLNIYFGEAEILDPEFEKVGTLKVLAANFDLENSLGSVKGDLAVNDGGQGYVADVTLERRIGRMRVHLGSEYSHNFTGLKAKDGFHNVVDIPGQNDHRERSGFEAGASYFLGTVEAGATYEDYEEPLVNASLALNWKDGVVDASGSYSSRVQKGGWRILGAATLLAEYGKAELALSHSVDLLQGDFLLVSEEDLFGQIDEYEPHHKLKAQSSLRVGPGLWAVSETEAEQEFSGLYNAEGVQTVATVGLDYKTEHFTGALRFPLTGLATYRAAATFDWTWRFIGVGMGSYYEIQRDSGLDNVGVSLDVTLKPNDNFEFQAGWTYDDKAVNVNNPGLKVNRTAGLVYHWTERLSAEFDFVNVQFVDEDPTGSFVVEQTVGSLTYRF